MDPSGPIDGTLASGVLTVEDLAGGPFEADFQGFLQALGNGELYVNVHTAEFPTGEIRGQLGVRMAAEGDDGIRNRAPNGVITSPGSEESVSPGQSVFFAGMASDPDGDPVTVEWDFGDGETSTEMSPGDHTYADAGSYTVTFTATDDKGLSDPSPDTRTITVVAANNPPDGGITEPAGDVNIAAGESVTFAGIDQQTNGHNSTGQCDCGEGLT